nr:hypothetical protein CFP56_17883 [Quercus suber]
MIRDLMHYLKSLIGVTDLAGSATTWDEVVPGFVVGGADDFVADEKVSDLGVWVKGLDIGSDKVWLEEMLERSSLGNMIETMMLCV